MDRKSPLKTNLCRNTMCWPCGAPNCPRTDVLLAARVRLSAAGHPVRLADREYGRSHIQLGHTHLSGTSHSAVSEKEGLGLGHTQQPPGSEGKLGML